MHSSEVEPYIVFPVASFLLALPVTAVVKVVNYPTTNTEAGFVYLNHHPIPLLNLHQQLPAAHPTSDAGAARSQPEEGQERTAAASTQLLAHAVHSAPLVRPASPFLAIAYCQEDLYAIPVDEPPNWVKIARSSIRPLPKTFSRQGLFTLIDEIAVAEPETTVFLLNLRSVGTLS